MDIHFHGQVSLELGGKSPNIVFESADLEQGRSAHLGRTSEDPGLVKLTVHHSVIQRLLGQHWEFCIIWVRAFGA